MAFPIRTERYKLRTEPCAAGKWRGGIGMVRVNRMLVDTIVNCEGERHESNEPWGIFGGGGGLNASVVRNRGGSGEEAWPSKFTGFRLAAGNSIEITVPNSGSYGEPLERDSALVLADVLDGFTTVELAREDYGVVIEPDPLRLDADATRKLRAERASDAHASPRRHEREGRGCRAWGRRAIRWSGAFEAQPRCRERTHERRDFRDLRQT